MENLKELLLFCQEFGNRKTFKNISGDNKFSAFLESLSQPGADEQEIVRQLYGEKSSSTAYRELKRRVHEFLLEEVFRIAREFNFQNVSVNRQITLRRNIFLSHFLVRQGYLYAASRIALSGYKRAKELFNFDLASEFLKLLRYYYAQTGNVKKVEICNRRIARYYKLMQKELEAENFLNYLQAGLKTNSELPDKTAKRCRKFIQLYRNKKFSPQFIRLRLLYARIFTLYMEHGPDKATDIARIGELWEAIEKFYLQNHQVASPSGVAELSYNLSRIYLYRGEFGQAQKLIKYASLLLTGEKDENFFLIRQAEFMLLCRQEKWKEAISLVKKTVASKQWEHLPLNTRLIWSLHLFSAQLMEGNVEENQWSPAFFAEIHNHFRHDRQGIKITVYIYDILHLIHRRDTEQALHRLDTFRKFIQSIENLEDKRILAFVKLLENFCRNYPSPKSSLEKKYRAVLNNHPPGYKAFRYEFVPFLHLYELLSTQPRKN